MNISWYGQSCFKIEGKNASILIDPFSKETGLRAPRLNADVILVTHNHYDHNNTEEVPPEAFVIRGPGEYEKAGIFIEGMVSYHDDVQGAQRGLNTIFTIKTEDMKLCHLGDLGQTKLTDEQIETIGNVDVLFVPIGGKYTIGAHEALGVIKDIEPKIIIPMHYNIPGLKMDIEGPQKFLKEIGIKPEEVDVFKIAAKNLPAEETKLIIFKI